MLWNHVGKTSSQTSIGQRIICRSVRSSARHRNAIQTKFQPIEATGGEPVPLGNVAKAFLFTGAVNYLTNPRKIFVNMCFSLVLAHFSEPVSWNTKTPET